MAKKKKKSNKANIAIIVICGVLTLVLIIVLCVYLMIKNYIGKIDIVNPGEYVTGDYETETVETIQGETLPSEAVSEIESGNKEFIDNSEVAEADHVKNILLIGIDNRHFENVQIQPGNSDTMILISINEDTKEIYMTSFMRDLYVYIDYPKVMEEQRNPDGSQKYVDHYDQLNRANAQGGPELLLDTIENNFKVKVDEYICVNFYSLIDIIDILGGIEMTITDAEAEAANNYIRDMDFDRGVENWETANVLNGGGTLLLNGVQAVGYARERQTAGSDYARTERQRAVLNEVFNKAKSMSITKLNELANTILPMVTTNITETQIMAYVTDAITYLTYDIKQMRVPFDDLYTAQNINGHGMLVPDYAATSQRLIDAIYAE